MHRTCLSLALLSVMSATLLSAPPSHLLSKVARPALFERSDSRVYPLTTPLAKTEQLDSVVSPNEVKVVFTYDGLKFSSWTWYHWENDRWVPDHKANFLYAADGHVVAGSSWAYDGGVWHQSSKTTYEYFENGYTQTLYFAGYNNVLTPEDKDSSYSSPDGTIEEDYHYSWNSGQWSLEWGSRQIEIFDNVGEVKERISYRFNQSTNGWNDSAKTQYSYTAQGEIDSFVEFDFDAVTNTYIPSSRYQYSYNARGLNDTIVVYGFSDSAWNIDGMWVLAYDANGNVTSYRNYEAAAIEGPMQLREVKSYEYDLNVRNAEVLTLDEGHQNEGMLFWQKPFVNKVVRSEVGYSEDVETVLYYYSPLLPSATPKLSASFTAPAPALQISGRTIRVGAEGPARLMLFSPQGRLVLDQRVSGQERVSLDHLAAGSYMARLVCAQRVHAVTVTLP